MQLKTAVNSAKADEAHSTKLLSHNKFQFLTNVIF